MPSLPLNSYSLRFPIAVALFTIASLSATESFAQCSCERYPEDTTALEELESSDVVFAGSVTSVHKSEPDLNDSYVVTVVFDVEKVWKGKQVRNITLENEVYGCVNGFTVGESWLVYSHRADDGSLFTGCCCSKTKRLERATKDLAELDRGESSAPEQVPMPVESADAQKAEEPQDPESLWGAGPRPTLHATVSMLLSYMQMDSEVMGGGGGEVDLGYRLGPVVVLARGSISRVSIGLPETPEPDRREGTMYQWGAAARLPLRSSSAAALWAETGLSRRKVYWDNGSRLGRNVASVAVGVDSSAVLSSGPKPQYLSFGLAARVAWALATTGDSPFDPGLDLLIHAGWSR